MARFLTSGVVRAAVTSGTLMASGDALCQGLRCRAAGREVRLDLAQTARFGLIGLTLHGPFFYHGFRWLDSRFGAAATLQKAVTKTLTGQVTLFPVYVAAFFTYMGLLEGGSLSQSLDKVRRAGPPTLTTGAFFWLPVNIANFMWVPPTRRVAYVNAAGLFWNAYLSLTNATRGSMQPAVAAAAAAGAAGSVRR